MTTESTQKQQNKQRTESNLFHHVFGYSLDEKTDAPYQTILLGMGCFWGAERLFWQHPGVVNTAVGFAGGHRTDPTYKEVCHLNTGHTEVVRVAYDPSKTTLKQLLTLFWENHDPTQGMKQGNDIGEQYRSAIYTTDPAHHSIVEQSLNDYQQALNKQQFGHTITTEVRQNVCFYLAEEEHQQYLSKNPHGYCGLKGTGICQITS